MTPLYERICNWSEQKHGLLFFICIVLLFALNELLFRQLTDYFNAAWINCYLIGYVLRRLQQKHGALYGMSVLAMLLVGALFIYMQVSVRYWQTIAVPDAWWPAYYAMCDYGHVFLGVTIFVIGRVLLSPLCKINLIQRILQLSDKYSYQIYLTHHFFILEPFTLMALTENSWLNVGIILVLTIVTAILLQTVSGVIGKKIKQ